MVDQRKDSFQIQLGEPSWVLEIQEEPGQPHHCQADCSPFILGLLGSQEGSDLGIPAGSPHGNSHSPGLLGVSFWVISQFKMVVVMSNLEETAMLCKGPQQMDPKTTPLGLSPSKIWISNAESHHLTVPRAAHLPRAF